METEFWGIEVKSGEPLKVSPGNGRVLHLSQASLGDHKHEKGKESVSLFVNVDGKKLVLGTLITNKLPQHLFDLLFDRDFELFHDWKSGSVYFYGYKASKSSGEDEPLEGESDESEYEPEENIPLNVATNGKHKSNAKQENPLSKVEQKKSESNAKQEKLEANAEQHKPESMAMQEKPEPTAMHEKPADAEGSNVPNERSDATRDWLKIVETHKHPQEDDESNHKDMVSEVNGEDNSQVETSKKRAVEPAINTPDPNKKAKVTSQEIGSTTKEPLLANSAVPILYTCSISTEPLPESDAVKNPADNLTSQKLKPYSCKFCKKKFGTSQGAEAHTKVKHGEEHLS